MHVAIWNRVQRADKADGKWRTLDSRALHNQRLAVAPVAERLLETKLSALGYVMVPRADGNGAEVGGVSQNVMDLFSSRAVAVTGELDRLAREYQAVHGKPPSRRTLWLLHQQAAQNTRLVYGSAPVRSAPGPRRPQTRRRRRGGGHRGGHAGRLRPAGTEVVQVTAPDPADVTSLGVRASDGGSIYRPPKKRGTRNEERGTVHHPGPPRHRRTDPRGREKTSPAARQPRRGTRGRRADRAERRAARRSRDDADRGHDGADRPGRGGQEPRHGRVRPAVDHVHRSAGHRPDHLHQRGPGTGPRGPGRELQHRRVPRQDRRLRRAAPTRPMAPERRARAR